MKVLVAFYSETGNTAQVAEAMGAAVSEDQEVVVRRVEEVVVEGLNEFGMVFLGGAVHDADLAKPVKQLLVEVPEDVGFMLAGFSTHAVSLPDGMARRDEQYEQWAGKCLPSFKRVCDQKGIVFLGYFHCQGAPSPSVEAFIHREILTSEKEWADYLSEARKHPTASDLANAKAFAREMMQKFLARKS